MSTAEAKAEVIMNKGRAHLDAGRREEAEKCFRQAAQTFMTPAALNNWALCRYLAGDYPDTLALLQPLLSTNVPLPFTRALAGMAHTARGEKAQALEQIRAAIRDFDRGLAQGAAADSGWVEYAVTVQRAAGEAGEHRLVLDLHGRWPGREAPIRTFMAGVAAFNLRKYGMAAKYWRRITASGWGRLREAYVMVADLSEQGLVPPFGLEYDPNGDLPDDVSPATAAILAAKGAARVRMLAAAFAAPDLNAAMVESLIAHTGAWGLDLGQRLLAGSRVSMSVKLGAIKALTDVGLFAPGQEIPIVQAGRRTTVVLRHTETTPPSPELDGKVDKAIRLRDSGRRDEAYELLKSLEEQGTMYPPAMVTLANLMRDRGELEAARSHLELADKLMPDHPGVLFNLAGVLLQLGQPQPALEVARRINPQGTPAEFQQQLADLTDTLRSRLGLIVDPMDLADAYRADVEEKLVSLELRLRTALKQLPVQWLNAAAELYHLEAVPRRPERERLLAEALLDPARAKRLLAAEDAETQDALRLVLEKGGWVKLQSLTRRYGPMDGDGFWWEERPPVSPVGRLRLLGLVFVGRANIDGRMHKVAVVPVELRGAKLL